MAKITYDDKVALGELPGIADINKIKDSDMNEIKGVVNTNDDNVGNLSNLNASVKTSIVAAINFLNAFSTNERLIGTDENGNNLYVKTIVSTHSGTSSNKATGITNLSKVRKIISTVNRGDDTEAPWWGSTDGARVFYRKSTNTIEYRTLNSVSNWEFIVDLYYTKTS